jgi:hypothetical protein
VTFLLAAQTLSPSLASIVPKEGSLILGAGQWRPVKFSLPSSSSSLSSSSTSSSSSSSSTSFLLHRPVRCKTWKLKTITSSPPSSPSSPSSPSPSSPSSYIPILGIGSVPELVGDVKVKQLSEKKLKVELPTLQIEKEVSLCPSKLLSIPQGMDVVILNPSALECLIGPDTFKRLLDPTNC